MELLTEQECEVIVKKCKHASVSIKDYKVEVSGKNVYKITIILNENGAEETLEFLGCPLAAGHFSQISPAIIYSNEKVMIFEQLHKVTFPLDLEQVKKIIRLLVELHAIHGFTKHAFNLNTKCLDHESRKLIDDSINKLALYKTVISHGNLTNQNILINTENEFKLIGFNKDFYAPPLYDVLQLIYFNTNEEFRQKYLQELVLFYRNELRKKLVNNFNDGDFEWCEKLLLPVIKVENAKRIYHVEIANIQSQDFISQEDCFVIARNKLGSYNYKIESYKVKPLGETNGFLGNYYKLKINIEGTSIDFFVKSMPRAGPSMQVVQDSDCFSREIFVYTHLVEKMSQLGIKSIKECLPECFFGRSDDILVFEDLSLAGYKILPSQIPFDFDILSMCVKKLAKFHGSLMVFEESQHFNYEQYKHFLREVFFVKDGKHSGAVLMGVAVKSILDIVDMFPEIDFGAEFKSKIWPKLLDVFYTAIHPSKKYRNILSHGDLWTNNILMKMQDNEVIDCRFVDFQVIRYCPPAHDFLSLLYLTTDRTNRRKYAEKLEEIYYEELGKVLQLHGFEIQQFFSRQELRDSVENIKPQMIIQSTIYYSFAMCTSEEINELLGDEEKHHQTFFVERKPFIEAMCKKSKKYTDKLREGMVDLLEISDRFRD